MRTFKQQRRRQYRPSIELLESRELLSGSPVWTGYGGNEHHTALSSVASQPLEGIRWQTPVDLQPQYSGNELLIHYGSPMITAADTVIVPVKTGATDGFRLEAHNGSDGTLEWVQTTDYILPASSWTTAFDSVLTSSNRLYFAGAGGTLYYINNPDASGTVAGHVAFYGIANYDPNTFNSTVFIDTPLTSDSQGNIYFGFRVQGTGPTVNGVQLQSGIARVAADGTGTWVSATAASGDSNIAEVPHSAAPALSNDESTLYVSVRSASTAYYGYLLGLDPTTLEIKQTASGPEKVFLKDPRNGGANPAGLPDISTASPLVGPDGDVYYGIFGNPYNGSRGFMLHFNSDLTVEKTPGAFGWDDTGSIVPASMVPSYTGMSSYLIMTKYNNYAGTTDGGDGVNKIAILDPNATQVESHPSSNGLLVMKEVLTIAGVTPDMDFRNQGFPNAVREWCINTAVVDPATDSVLANSEDGKVYRWNLATNSFTEVVTLTSGLGEAYTPTMIGADGSVYAINNATLFAVGRIPGLSVNDTTATQDPVNTTLAVFSVTVANPTAQTVTVPFLTADGTATSGVDYAFTSGSLTFAPGITTQTVNVPVLANPAYHLPKTFFLNLGTPTNAQILRGQGIATIDTNVPLPTLSVGDVSVNQSQTSSVDAVFTVTLSGPTEEPASVSFATANGTAFAGQDYTNTTGTLTFAAGQVTQTISVPVLPSNADSPPLTFTVLLSSPTNTTISRSQATGTINNTLPPPTITVSDASGADGDSGTTLLNFTISLSRPSRRSVSVTYSTSDGTARAPTDYIAVAPTTVTFAPGQTSMPISVSVIGNTISEPDKTFLVDLSNPINGTLGNTQGTGTILNDNGALTITDLRGLDGTNGTTQFIFNVRLVNPSTRPISVDVMTVDATAHAGVDYVAVPLTTLNFAPEQGFRNVTVLVNSDDTTESSDRSFVVQLSNPVNAVLVKAQGVGTIVNDDVPGSFQFSDASYSVSEAQSSATITVMRTDGSLGAASVNFASTGGTAPSGAYTPVSGTLMFANGETTKTFTIPIMVDNQVAVPQTVDLTLSNPTGGTSLGAQRQAVLNIIDIDGTPNQRFIMQIYRELLGREVDGPGFAAWTDLLNGGFSRTQVVQAIEGSVEYHVRLVNQIYLQYLGRAADLIGMQMGLTILGNPQPPPGGAVNQLRSILLGSEEYFLVRGGGTVAGFTQAFYQDVLNRGPDPVGTVGLEQFLGEGGTRQEAARRYLITLEADGVLVSNLFNRYLRRQITPNELPGFEFALLNGQIDELGATAIIVGSAEYFAHV
jgi:hypothetical protein